MTKDVIPAPEVVDARGASAIVGLSAATLNTMRCHGRGPPYLRIGTRTIRYRVADLRAWRDAQLVLGGDKP